MVKNSPLPPFKKGGWITILYMGLCLKKMAMRVPEGHTKHRYII